jgi:hypothetical protein
MSTAYHAGDFMSRYRLKLAALALLMLSATATPTAAAAQDTAPDVAQQAADAARLAACATPVAPGTPLTISGNGKTQTLPFNLAGGAYTVGWQVSASPTSTTYDLRLSPVVDAPFNHGQAISSGFFDKSPDPSGETHIYEVKPGRYYLAVNAPKGWSVTFTPLAV